jgi:hypothetical protein
LPDSRRQPEAHIIGRPNRPEDFERAVLVNVLAAHPSRLTIAELLREFDPEAGGRERPDAPIVTAIESLESVGLVFRDRALISATAAAIQMDKLLGSTL